MKTAWDRHERQDQRLQAVRKARGGQVRTNGAADTAEGPRRVTWLSSRGCSMALAEPPALKESLW